MADVAWEGGMGLGPCLPAPTDEGLCGRTGCLLPKDSGNCLVSRGALERMRKLWVYSTNIKCSDHEEGFFKTRQEPSPSSGLCVLSGH